MNSLSHVKKQKIKHGLRGLFSLDKCVTRTQYISVGFGLMAFKYLIECLFVYSILNKFWTPTLFLLPIASFKIDALGGQASWAFWCLVIWSLPFLWIGVSMSIRRLKDIGASPWWFIYFLLPIVNLLFMLVLCVIPSRLLKGQVNFHSHPIREQKLNSILVGIAGGVLICLLMMGLIIFIFGQYNVTLFFGTPLFASFFAGYQFNKEKIYSMKLTIGLAALTLLIASCAFLLFALEGFGCLLMAFPIGLMACIPGALLGRMTAVSQHVKMKHILLVLLCLPLIAAVDTQQSSDPLREVQSSVVIDVSPEQVWNYVIRFSDLPQPQRWVFSLGIAYPVRARIEGEGVGAIRYCEFSTGAFVEPITHWDPPTRLSFDVTENPPTMQEWSPYRKIHAPHLTTTFFSKRGEFRLKALDNGKTLLEGSTWYVQKLAPLWYWHWWSDLVIHKIHQRVLEHIKTLSEKMNTK